MTLKMTTCIAQITQSAAIALTCSLSAQAATAGPGTWSTQQTWGADAVNGGNLTGYFYFPATQPINSNGKRALVLVLHGCSQTATNDVINGSDGGFNWKTVADQYGAVVLAPNATGNVSYAHCWDYSRTNHSRTTGHEKVLLDLIATFKNNSTYAIDPNHVYVTGLSSGGGETIVLGCIAPDIFAGIGINAGPTPGTTTGQVGAVPSGYTSTTAKNNCNALAGSYSGSFATQIAGAVWGTSDTTVAPAYGPLMTSAFRQIYGGTYTQQATQTITGGGSNIPYKDSSGRVRTHEITVTGMAHAWPAGPGGQNTNYVTNTKINYPAFLMDFWFKNNIRDPGNGTTTTTTSGGTTTTTATSPTTTAGACFNTNNAAHVTAGRAHNNLGYADANGSNQRMGLNNTFYTRKLRMTGSNYYIIDSTCP